MSQTHTLTGRISIIGEIKQVSDKFKTRDVIIDTDDGQYAQLIKMEFSNMAADVPDNFKIGDAVTITFNLRGRKHNDAYYNTLAAYKMEKR